MDFLTKEERDNLVIEYKHMHDENWQRGQGIWLVNSILVTGSLLVAFQSNINGFPTPIVSLFLVVIAGIIQVTASKVTSETYKKMKEIRKKLGMTETEELYKSIVGKWWYVIRTNAAYALFIFLVGIYLYLIIADSYITIIVYCTGFIILLVKEMYSLSRRA